MKLAILALVALLTACGGSTEDEPRAAAAIACTARVATVALFGDSTMRGPEDLANPNRPQALLQAGLDARFGAGAVRVTLHAYGGAEVFDLVAGARGFQRWPAGADADVVVVSFGVNEAANGVTLERYSQGLGQIATRPLLWSTPLPVRAGGDKPYAEAFRAAARAHGGQIIEARGYVLGLPNWGALLSDGIHPSEALYQAIVRDVTLPAVAAAVAPIRCESARAAAA